MGLPVKIYRWDDVGAPGLTDARTSSIINVFKKVLVEGYGTKQPLGWTIDQEDAQNFKIAFRNSTVSGSGGRFILSGHTGFDDILGMRCQSAIDMVDFNNLITAGYKQAFKIFPNSVQYPNTKWIVIGNSVGFIFISDYEGSYSNDNARHIATVYAGDITPTTPADVGVFITFASPISTSHTPVTDTSGAGGGYGQNLGFYSGATAAQLIGGALLMPDTDLASNQSQYSLARYLRDTPCGRDSPSGLPSYNVITNINVNYNIPYGGAVDRDGISIEVSNTRPVSRGFIKGVCEILIPMDKSKTWPFFVTYENVDYFVMRNTQPNSPSITLISLGDW
ncbi:hypothetical protein CXF80_18215 [Shewanella sp. Actino-trap-3]|uniref:hypothetical protein n=1 Tax=Shewanella sp. Actino-trap-3 TaxID=2058331 RepID=UPI000C331479|nr:hypothetical protein [Shewanella sp. Actino-trap-3]PKG80077.1 hypothetical protein CXF80_18215 [Shewanella sp. Actino-trap-3]